MPTQKPFWKIVTLILTVTLTDDLDLGSTKRSYYPKENTCEYDSYDLPFKSYHQCLSVFLKNVSLIYDLDLRKCPLAWYKQKVLPQGLHM